VLASVSIPRLLLQQMLRGATFPNLSPGATR